MPATADGILQAVRNSGAQVVLVNIWATWCEPCREEFPDLVRLQRDYYDRGLKVIFISTDFDTELPQVVKFLAEHGVEWPSYIKAQKDMEFINGLEPHWSGALPATFIYDHQGALRDFWIGETPYATFEQKVLGLLNE